MDKLSKKKAPAKAAKPAAEKKAKTEEAATTGSARGPLARETGGDSYRILLRPVISEKSANLQMKGNQYTFAVANSATKVDVARAISDLYGVKPVKVRMINVEGKFVRFGRTVGREKNVKKAVITLKQGETISL